MHRIISGVVLSAVLMAGFAAAASAQMNNRPYSFPGGSGFSNAGAQAILNDKFFGERPDMIRTDDGRLFTVERGPGGTPIVSTASGEVLARFHGRGVRRELRAGEFNSFFAKTGSGSPNDFHEPNSTHVTIDSWTGSVLAGRPTGYGGGSVDQWTSMVHYLN